MSELQHNLAYLATPYSKYFGGDLERAFVDASKLAANLLLAGVKVYSPIAHTHPLAIHGGLDPLDHAIWLPFDEAMMSAAEILIVAHMDGWQESKGIAHEIAFFETRGKPIYDLNPETMVMKKRLGIKPPRDRIDNASEDQLEQDRASFLENKPLAHKKIPSEHAGTSE